VQNGRTSGTVRITAINAWTKEEFTRSFVEHMLEYALGRKLDFYDVRTVRDITTRVAQDQYKFSRVVVEVARSYPFRHRRVK
jgi:hypothetical protein